MLGRARAGRLLRFFIQPILRQELEAPLELKSARANASMSRFRRHAGVMAFDDIE
jgi:hypothetical protein